MGYNVVSNKMGNEGCSYLTKSNWKITKLSMSKLIIIKMALAWGIISIFDSIALNPTHRQWSIIYDAKQSIIGFTNMVFCLLGTFDKFIYLFNESILSDFWVHLNIYYSYFFYLLIDFIIQSYSLFSLLHFELFCVLNSILTVKPIMFCI